LWTTLGVEGWGWGGLGVGGGGAVALREQCAEVHQINARMVAAECCNRLLLQQHMYRLYGSINRYSSRKTGILWKDTKHPKLMRTMSVCLCISTYNLHKVNTITTFTTDCVEILRENLLHMSTHVRTHTQMEKSKLKKKKNIISHKILSIFIKFSDMKSGHTYVCTHELQ
jgi:hypothetical protein